MESGLLIAATIALFGTVAAVVGSLIVAAVRFFIRYFFRDRL